MSAPDSIAPFATGVAEIAARRGAAAALAARLTDLTGLAFPEPGRTTRAPGATAIRIAPDACFVLADPDIVARLVAGIPPAVGAVNDQSSGYAAFRLAAPDIERRLARICRLDLRAFVAGHAGRTAMLQIPAVLWRPEATAFGLLVPATLARAFADGFAHATG